MGKEEYILVWKCQGKRPRRSWRRWVDNIKMETSRKRVSKWELDWSGLR